MNSRVTLSAARNRENQRRSRARRKDYIQNLETRLRQHEIAGIKATTEVQSAARKVAEENRRLRALLRTFGIETSAQIEEILGGGSTCIASDQVTNGQTRTFPSNEPSVSSQPGSSTKAHCVDLANSSTSTHHSQIVGHHDGNPDTLSSPWVSSVTDARSASALDPHADDNECVNKTDPNTECVRTLIPKPPSMLTQQNSFREIGIQSQASDTGDEISCLVAAEIIAGMRGHSIPNDIWSELGCKSTKQCMVHNMAVFQIMDAG